MFHKSVVWIPCSYNIQNEKKIILIFLNIMRTSSFEFYCKKMCLLQKLVGAGSLWPFSLRPLSGPRDVNRPSVYYRTANRWPLKLRLHERGASLVLQAAFVVVLLLHCDPTLKSFTTIANTWGEKDNRSINLSINQSINRCSKRSRTIHHHHHQPSELAIWKTGISIPLLFRGDFCSSFGMQRDWWQ
jgi:hypothetical protein